MWRWFKEYWDFIIMVGLSAGFIIFILGFVILSLTHEHQYKEYSHNIVSLNRSKELNGSFFLGSGTIRNSQYYFMYKVTKTGEGNFYKLLKSPASKTVIRETNNYPPGVVFTYIDDYMCGDNHLSKVTITIPTGSIIQEFKP